MINRKHPLFVLAYQNDWCYFEEKFGLTCVDGTGSPGKPIWLTVGLNYIKYTLIRVTRP